MSSSSRKLLQAAAGSAKKDYLEDYFSITHYTGNASNVTTGNPREIETGVDISVDGGVMFFYMLDGQSSSEHAFVTTDFSVGQYINQEDASYFQTDANGIQSYSLSGPRKGFTMGPSTIINKQGINYAVVTIRKKEKFMATYLTQGSDPTPDNPLNTPPIAAWAFRVDSNDGAVKPKYWQNNIGNGVGLSDQYVGLYWDDTDGIDTGLYGYGTAPFFDYTPGNTSSTLQLGGVQGNNFGVQYLLVLLGPGYEFSHDGNTPAIKTIGWTGDGSFNKKIFPYSPVRYINDQWMFTKRCDDNTTGNNRWQMWFERMGLKSETSGNQSFIVHAKNDQGSTQGFFGSAYHGSYIRQASHYYEIQTNDANLNSNGVYYVGLTVATPARMQEPVSGQQVVSIRDGLNPPPSSYPNYGNPSNNGPASGVRMGLFDSSDVSGISVPDFILVNGDGTNGAENNGVLQISQPYPTHYQEWNKGPTGHYQSGYNISMVHKSAWGSTFNTGNRKLMRDGFYMNSSSFGSSAASSNFEGGKNDPYGSTGNGAKDVTFAFFKARPKTMSWHGAQTEGTFYSNYSYHNLDGGAEMVWVKSDDYQNAGGKPENWYVWHSAFDTGTTSTLDYIKLNSSEGKLTAGTSSDHPFSGLSPLRQSTSYVYVNSGWLSNTNGHNYQTCAWRTNPGITKVGTYTGTGSTLMVQCGFGGPARFILIKRYDDNGRWYMFWNDPRSNTSNDDQYDTTTDYDGMQINSSGEANCIAWPDLTGGGSGEQTSASNGNTMNPRENRVFFVAGTAGSGMEGGFKLAGTTANTTININGASYLFLAIA